MIELEPKYLKISVFFGLILLLLVSPLVFSPYVTTFPMAKQTFSQLVAIMVLVLWAIWLAVRGKVDLKTPLTFPVLLLAATLLISLINTASFYRSTLGLGVWGTYILAFFVVISVVNKKKWLKVLFGTALFAGLVAAIYLIFQFYGVDFPFWALQEGRRRLYSTFGNPNYVASYLIGCIPLAFTWYLSLRDREAKFALGTLISVLYTAVIMTYTRSSWGGLFLGAVFIAVASLLYLKRSILFENKYWIVGLLAVLLLVSVIYSTPNPINYGKRSAVVRATSTIADPTPLGKRLLIWLSTVEIAKDHPIIGAGVGSLGVNYPEAQGEVLAKEGNQHLISMTNKSINAHNDLLHMWAEIGAIGVLALILVLGLFYWKGIDFIRSSDGKSKSNFLAIGLMGGVLAMLGQSIFSFPFQITPNGLLIFLFLASLMVLLRTQSGGENDEKKTGVNNQKNSIDLGWAPLRWFVVVIVIVGSIWLGVNRVNIYRADAHVHRAQMNLESGRAEISEKLAQQAKEINPHAGNIYAIMGKARLTQDDYRGAIEALKGARKNYIYQRLFIHLGYAYRKLGELDKSERYLKKNIRYFPNFSNAYVQLARTYALKGESYLEENNLDRAEHYLDLAGVNHLQAKAYGTDFSFPRNLPGSYRQLGIELTETGTSEIRTENFEFHSTGRLTDAQLLPVGAHPEDPILLKLLFKPDLAEKLEGNLEVYRVQGTNEFKVSEIRFEKGEFPDKRVAMLTAFLRDGLSVGNYYLRTHLGSGAESEFLSENLFTVAPPGGNPLEIRRFTMPDILPDQKGQEIIVPLGNNTSGSIKANSVLEVKNTQGEVRVRNEIPAVAVPPGEQTFRYTYGGRNLKYLEPGKYVAEFIIKYQDREVRARDTFVLN